MSETKQSFPAVVQRVIDGDTVLLRVDFSAAPVLPVTCRLLGIQAPEMGSKANPDLAGWLAKSQVINWLSEREGQTLVVDFLGRDKYGRSLVEIRDDGGECLNEFLLRSGNAKPFMRRR